MGSVLSIWHDYREAGSEDPYSAELPPMDELERAAEHTDIHDIVIDEEASTVYLTDPDMSLDVGSIGKGYAVQKVAEYAKNELGIRYMLFSVGEMCALLADTRMEAPGRSEFRILMWRVIRHI